MQVYVNSNRLSIKTLLVFSAVALIAFSPVSSFLFFLKNDAFVGYFPPKFIMSESLHAGYLPLWNPYINFGFPQYGDMSGGYWSPVTWLIAATVGYNAYSFTIELLAYILIGGIGMFQLAGIWHLDKRVKFIAGIAFMCSGYMVGHLQHFNWISGAAMLPWCCWCYLLLLKNRCWKHILQAVLFFYLLVSSAHPGIIIASFYFFFALLCFHIFNNELKLPLKVRFRETMISHCIFIPLFLILCAGMFSAYLDILPHLVRGEKISLANSLLDPSNIKTWISALLPFATVKNNAYYNTDISMRNSYSSLALLLFFLWACLNKKTGWQKFLLAAGVAYAFLAAGGIVKIIAYKLVPFIGYVRLNGEFSIFSILCFILFAAIALNKFLADKTIFAGRIKYCFYFIEILLIGCIVFGLLNVIGTRLGVLYNFSQILKQPTIALSLKAMVDGVHFYDCFWMQGLVQWVLLRGIKHCIKTNNLNLLKTIVVVDMIVASLFNIPFTGVGKESVTTVQAMINTSPAGIPIPNLKPIKNIDSSTVKQKEMIGDWSMYNKQIGVTAQVYYPIVLKNMSAYFENNLVHPEDNFLSEGFVFINNKEENKLLIKKFSPNNIAVEMIAADTAQLILQQNFYPHWFYKAGGLNKEVEQAGINFMRAPVKKGTQIITFSFEPQLVKWSMLISLISFSLYSLVLLVLIFKPFKN